MFGDGAVQAVFNGEDSEVDGARLDSFAGLGGERAGHDFDGYTGVLRDHCVDGGDVGVGTQFALDRHLGCRFQRGWIAQSTHPGDSE